MIIDCIFGLLTILAVFFSTEHCDKKFDELQQLKRSKAYKFGFLILMAYFFIDSTIRNNGIEWCDHDDSFLLGIAICFSFINLYLIVTESLQRPNEKTKSWLYFGLFFTIFAVYLLINCAISVFKDGIFEEKSLSHSFMQTIVCIMFLFVGILTIIYYFKMKTHEKEQKE